MIFRFLRFLRRWRQRRITVSKFASYYVEYIETLNIKPKTVENRRRSTAAITEQIGHMAVIDVRPSHIARIIAAIHGSGRKVTSRRVLYEASCLFYRAVLEGIITQNPADPIRAMPAPPERSRLTLGEWRAIEQYYLAQPRREWFVCTMRLALVTGQRRSDLVRMQFGHVIDDHLRIEQYKTGARISLPLSLHLDAINMTLREAISDCRSYAPPGEMLVRKSNGNPYGASSLSARFKEGRIAALPDSDWSPRTPPTFHEIRSLSERLYRAQGIDTMTLLGHKRQRMTDEYNDDRGLYADQWRELKL